MQIESEDRSKKAASFLSLNSTHVDWQGKKLLSFASHDYLGISQHPDLKKNAMKVLLQYGTGTCHKEIPNSYIEYERQLAERCSERLEIPALSFFSSRWTALEMALASLQSANGTCFIDIHCDPLLHLIAKKHFCVVTYDTKDQLQQLIEMQTHPCGPQLLLTESLLSANGRYCDLALLLPLAKKYHLLMLVDHSNSFGVESNGDLNVHKDRIDFFICALDRGAAAAGAFVATHLTMDFLLHAFPIHAREWAPSFSTLGAIDASLELIALMDGERKQLHQRCHWLRTQLKSLEIPMISHSHFFCFSFADKSSAECLWQQLLQQGILAEFMESMRGYLIRIVINAQHTLEDLDALLSFFVKQKQLAIPRPLL